MKWNKTFLIAFAASIFSIGAYTTAVHAQEEPMEEIIVEEAENEQPILIEENVVFDLVQPELEEIILPEEEEEIIENNTGIKVGIYNTGTYSVIYDDNGDILKGLQIYLGHAYYLDPITGAISVGFVSASDGRVYYCNNDGWIQTGEFKVGKVTVITDKRGSVLKSDVGSVPYFNQKDARWANKKIGLGTIGQTGCAMNVMTSVVNYLLDAAYTPIDMGNLMYQYGHYNKTVQGTKGTAWPEMANHFQLDFQLVPTKELAEQALKKGYLVAAGIAKDFINYPYTHEILFYGYNGNGQTNVYDPNNMSLNGIYTLSYLYGSGMPSWDDDDKYMGTSYFAIGLKPTELLDINLQSLNMIVSIPNQNYTGSAIVPDVSIQKKINSTYRPLVMNRDFIIKSVSNNVNEGTATIILEGIGTYSGTRTATFSIVNGGNSQTPPGQELPGTDTPGTETPGTDTPGTDTPGTDTPGTDTPGTDTPGTDTPGTDTPETPGNDPEEPATPVTQIIANGTYTLSSKENSGYCLNNSYGSTSPSQQYIVLERSGSKNQNYIITYIGDGYYTIKNAASNMYICCNADPATTTRQYINQTTNGSGNAAQWFIENVGGAYIIRSKMNTNYVINIDALELTGAREVVMWEYVPGDTFQQWNFEKK